jgi:hypothetical protein
LLRLSENRYALITRPNASEPDDPFARVIDLQSGAPVISDEQVPLRELAEPEGLEIVDPMALGIDLPKLLHHSQQQAAADGAAPATA